MQRVLAFVLLAISVGSPLARAQSSSQSQFQGQTQTTEIKQDQSGNLKSLPALHSTRVFIESSLANRGDDFQLQVYQSAILFEQSIHPRFLEEFGPPDGSRLDVELVIENINRSDNAVAVTDDSMPSDANRIFINQSLLGRPEFSLTAFHELQHLYSFKIGKHGLKREDYWLNEGLSLLVESYFAQNPPQLSLDSVAQTGQTCSLAKTPSSLCRPEELRGTLFLLADYINQHAGGHEAIRHLIYSGLYGLQNLQAVLTSASAIDPAYKDVSNFLFNFSAAVMLNRTGISRGDLLALSTSGFHMQPTILTFDFEKDVWQKRFDLGSYQARYARIPFHNHCLSINTPKHVFAYLLSPNGPDLMRKALPTECFAQTSDGQTSLMLVNLSEDSATATVVDLGPK